MKTGFKALALTTLFASSSAFANDNNTNGTVVCDASNWTNLELIRTTVEPSTQPQLGAWYTEIEVRNRGAVPNATPLEYSIYKNDANGNRILPAVDTRTNVFPMPSGDTSVRFFYPTHNFGDVSIPSYTVEITYPCSTNENDNTIVGPLPGTISPYPPQGDLIFRDGFENSTPAPTWNGADVEVKSFSNTANGGVVAITEVKETRKPAVPALKIK